MDTLLKQIGFVDVTGFEESLTVTGRVSIAPTDCRQSWNENQGIYVVIDEDGHSWVLSKRALRMKPKNSVMIANELMVIGGNNLSRKSLFVPFSNDGGNFAMQTWPESYKKRDLNY